MELPVTLGLIFDPKTFLGVWDQDFVIPLSNRPEWACGILKEPGNLYADPASSRLHLAGTRDFTTRRFFLGSGINTTIRVDLFGSL